jgi:hypothetical protein
MLEYGSYSDIILLLFRVCCGMDKDHIKNNTMVKIAPEFNENATGRFTAGEYLFISFFSRCRYLTANGLIKAKDIAAWNNRWITEGMG